jgi:hypothetical protein
LHERATEVFDSGASPEPVSLVPLHAKIGQLAWLAWGMAFLESTLTKGDG